VIGAGCVGLAIARALSLAQREVLLVDRASTIGAETSSRNSEVIHAGLYYPPKSLKARLCVQGKQQLYEYCAERYIPFNNCGKLIVANNNSSSSSNSNSTSSSSQQQQQQQSLEALRRQALQNGVDDVRILTPDDVQVLEPQVECSGGALWSPSTGVLDSHSYMTSLLADAEASGTTTLALQTTVQDARIGGAEDSTNTTNPAPLHLKFSDGTWVSCDAVVNAAGLWAHQIARLFHPPTSSSSPSSPSSPTSSSSPTTTWQPPRHYFAKGTYFRLQGVRPMPFQRLIYPVPEPGGLGVHATIDWAGQSVKFGPDVEWVDASSVDDPSQISLIPDPERGDRFYEQVRKYWSHLPEDALVPDYVGIRPKLNHPSINDGTLGFEDFRIIDEETHGVKGLVHLFGIESPGLTSSMAIGDYVAHNIINKGD
jgi:L-2-hydroxyglutarate oxidase LhgO